MEKNRLKRGTQEGRLTLVAGNYDTADMIDLVGSLGLFDGVWIEMEHGPVTWSQLGDLCRAADLWGMSSLVRVRDNDPTLISLTLGEGVDGVIVPHVNTREEAERVVDATLVSPIGHRGVSGGRKSYGRSDHHTAANDETFVSIMIEDVVAIDNLPEILKVPHIDVFFVSRYDLSQSMGLLHDVHNVRVQEALDRALGQIIAAGRTAGSAGRGARPREVPGHGRPLHQGAAVAKLAVGGGTGLRRERAHRAGGSRHELTPAKVGCSTRQRSTVAGLP